MVVASVGHRVLIGARVEMDHWNVAYQGPRPVGRPGDRIPPRMASNVGILALRDYQTGQLAVLDRISMDVRSRMDSLFQRVLWVGDLVDRWTNYLRSRTVRTHRRVMGVRIRMDLSFQSLLCVVDLVDLRTRCVESWTVCTYQTVAGLRDRMGLPFPRVPCVVDPVNFQTHCVESRTVHAYQTVAGVKTQSSLRQTARGRRAALVLYGQSIIGKEIGVSSRQVIKNLTHSIADLVASGWKLVGGFVAQNEAVAGCVH